MCVQQRLDGLGSVTTWGDGPEVVFLSNPLANAVWWTGPVRSRLLDEGFSVTAFQHECEGLDWHSTVECVGSFLATRKRPVAVVGWSQGAAIAQEVTLAHPENVTCAVLLATYGRQNEIDRVLQQCWDLLASGGTELDPLRLALGLLTAFPAAQLADDEFVAPRRRQQEEWAGRPDPEKRRRASTYIATYQDRLDDLGRISLPCIVMGFEQDTDTFAGRAREVANVIPDAHYLELPGVGHLAPMTHPDQVWPPVIDFLREHHHRGTPTSRAAPVSQPET
jgi:pimeloyl-ACP methyl ester carboxylesterase